jgi:hypothetical protein
MQNNAGNDAKVRDVARICETCTLGYHVLIPTDRGLGATRSNLRTAWILFRHKT